MTNGPVDASALGQSFVFSSKIDMVSAALRSKITSGDFAPGSQLRQRDLAKTLGVSITPIREALRRLESEGLVTYDPHVGATVVEVDFGPTEENFQIRAALESLAASFAAERASDNELDEIEAIMDRMNSDLGVDAMVALNRQFHFGIYDAARSPLLNSLIRRLWQSFGGGPVALHNVEESLAQHRSILDALRAGDVEASRERTAEHILSGMKRMESSD